MPSDSLISGLSSPVTGEKTGQAKHFSPLKIKTQPESCHTVSSKSILFPSVCSQEGGGGGRETEVWPFPVATLGRTGIFAAGAIAGADKLCMLLKTLYLRGKIW